MKMKETEMGLEGVVKKGMELGEMAFNKDGGVINWFLAHMAAATRAIRQRLKLSVLVIKPTMAGLRYSSSTMMRYKHLARARAETTCWSTSTSCEMSRCKMLDHELQAAEVNHQLQSSNICCRGRAQSAKIKHEQPRSATSCRGQARSAELKHELLRLTTSCRAHTCCRGRAQSAELKHELQSSNIYSQGQPQAAEVKHEV
ncbi:hypothetical protein SLEP1_g19400 [Rubroshorea leprosula]|nr:hypothetical protein SLEP1_g19400 [Rubroshorea leprosula]